MNKMKKGFTIVELVIVIAVIAILAAVLIPTFSNIIRSANESTDSQLVRNLNTILVTDKAANGKHTNYQQVLDLVDASGYDVAKIMKTKATDNAILWDSKNDIFCYLKGDEVVYIPNSIDGDPTKENVDLWKVYSDIDSAKADTSGYSAYLAGEDLMGEISIAGRGIDVGRNAGITKVSYFGAASAQNVVIRTNSYDTTVTVNAPKDTVKHFDKANKVDVIAVATASYHEHGDVLGNVTLNHGRVVVEANANANAVVIEADAADITAGTVIVSANNDKAPEVPIIVKDDVKTAADAKGGANSIPAEVPNSDKVIILSDKVIDEQGNKTDEVAVAYNKNTKKNYPSLIDAISDASANDVIMLQNNITTDKDVLIDFSLTIDGNGFTLNNTRDGSRAINIGNRVSLGTVVNNVEVTIKNMTIICSGTTGNFGNNGSLEERGLQLTVVENSTINIDNVKFEMGDNYSYSLKPMSSKNVVINVSNSVLTGANCVETNNLKNSTMNFTNTFLHNTYNENIVSHIGSAFNFVSSDGNILNIENCTYAGKNSQKYGYEDGTFNVVNGDLEEWKEPVV